MALWRARLGPLDGTAGWGALPEWLLRAGLAFVFAYAALSAFIEPSTLASYLPGVVPATWSTPLSWAFAGYETGLVMALLTRRHLFAASLLSAATLAAVIVVNPSAFGVLFRNVAIICAALALAVSTPASPLSTRTHPKHLRRQRVA